MPSAHATLSPSKAERWSTCPGSVALCETMPKPPESAYAAEGTAAHALAELVAQRRVLGAYKTEKHWKLTLDAWGKEHGIEADSPAEREMLEHASDYADVLRERMAAHPGSVLLLEQRVETGVPSCWGTSDAVIVSPTSVEVVDLKYGQGVKVEAEGNPQLRLYGVGALEMFGDLLGDVEEVTYTIYQPRLEHVSSETVKAEDLRAWRDSLIPVAEEALAGSDVFEPSEAACRWCPASGRCKAQLEKATAQDFGQDVMALSPEETAAALEILPEVEAWAKALKAAALEQVYREGVAIPGWKAVMGGQRRQIRDEAEAVSRIIKAGLAGEDELTVSKLRGIGELEKIVGGKKALEEALGDALGMTTGSPSLVRDSDRRKAASVASEAAKDFAE